MHRYVGSYNLDKGPVFYEAYYPDTRDARQEKRYFGRNTVLETSFQVPLERFAHSTENHPISINESFFVVNNEETLPKEERMTRRSYDTITSQLAPFPNERSIFDNDKNSQVANLEEISKLVRKAISHDLENWSTLEGYIDRIIHQDPRPMPQLGMHSEEIHSEREGNMFPVNREPEDRSLERSLIFGASLPKKLEASSIDEGQLAYFEGVEANGNTMTKMKINGTQAADTPPLIAVTPDSLPPENIFQPRPQLIKYIFFKRPVPPRLDKQNEKATEELTSRISGDNLVHEEIADSRIEENVKVTSIEISELPRHKTRHHHGEWPKRDYSVHHHHSQPTHSPTVS